MVLGLHDVNLLPNAMFIHQNPHFCEMISFIEHYFINEKKSVTAMYLLFKKNIMIVLLGILFFSCNTTEKIRTGDQAMERKQYAVAIELYQKEINAAKPGEKAEISYRIGESYRQLRQAENSLKWYLRSAEAGKKSDELYFYTGLMSKQTGRFRQAIEYFDKVSPKNNQLQLDARREKDICRQAEIWNSKKDLNLDPDTLVSLQSRSVYLSGFDQDGNFLISAEKETQGHQYRKHKWTGRPFMNLFYSNNLDVSQLKNFGDRFNTPFHEADLTISASGTELVFTRCHQTEREENFCQLYYAVKMNQNWSEPQKMPFQDEKVNYGHGFFSGDSLLFFSSNDPSGIGGYDLYFVRKEKNSWTRPVLLSAPVNTPGNEFYPTIKGDTLYFSSDYLPGLGGLDIFKSYPLSSGGWSPPQNMLPPFNSISDDFGLHYSQNEGSGHFAYINSNRHSLDGTDGIFGIAAGKISVADPEIVRNESDNKKDYKLFLSLRVLENVFEDPENPNSMVLGKKPVNKAEGLIVGDGKVFSTDLNGRFITELSFGRSYSIILNKATYLTYYLELPEKPYPGEGTKSENHTISREVILKKIFLDREMVMEDIYYDLDKWDIREDALPSLNSLLSTLVKNPELKVLIGSHTDCRADDGYNLELSKKRAESVVNFLIRGGITEERINYVGYGETRLIEKCPCEQCTEEQHQKNRRTTFTLTKK